MDDIQILRAAVNTLNQITVCGEDNMSKLLGTINALKDMCERGEQNGRSNG